MTSSRSQAVSLYQLALGAEQPPMSVQISPKTFRSVVKAVLNYLSSQQGQATLWVKLPPRPSWQQALERSLKQSGIPHHVYRLERRDRIEPEAEDLSLASNPNPEPVGVSLNRTLELDLVEFDEMTLISDAGMISSTDRPTVHELTIPIASRLHLRQEYFLLILSDAFSGLFLAHRPRSIHPTSDRSPQEKEADEESDRRFLLTLCSFDAIVLGQVMDGLRQVVQTSRAAHPELPELTRILETWETQSAVGLNGNLNPVLLSHLFAQQIQQQELAVTQIEHDHQHSDTMTTLRSQNEQLSNVIRFKDEFLNNVGQELRTPLTNMKTALTLLNSPHLKPPQRQRYMDMISRECDRQSSLISGVLDLLQLERSETPEEMQPLSLVDIVPGVVSTYQPLATEKGILLAYTVPEELPPVACLQTWLRQIMINLLHNGIKFTPSGGQVWVKAKAQNDTVALEIQDTGVGINPADVPKIFDRFYRVRHPSSDAPEGAGLGLTIVQQLLIRCGGSIAVRSQPGKGSVFTVHLPVYQAAKPHSTDFM